MNLFFIDLINNLYFKKDYETIKKILNTLTDKQKELFLNLHFNIEYRNEISDLIKYNYTNKYAQDDIDKYLYCFGFFYKTI